jgi:hypothetical protein
VPRSVAPPSSIGWPAPRPEVTGLDSTRRSNAHRQRDRSADDAAAANHRRRRPPVPSTVVRPVERCRRTTGPTELAWRRSPAFRPRRSSGHAPGRPSTDGRDPLQPTSEAPRRLISATPWRWPRGLKLTQRLELVSAE